MTDEQKADVQFWFYNRIFVNKETPETALERAAREAGLDREVALRYLQDDGRVREQGGGLQLVRYEQDSARPDGVWVDIEWMVAILRGQAGLRGPELVDAVGLIYKLGPQSAQEELAAVPVEEGSDDE